MDYNVQYSMYILVLWKKILFTLFTREDSKGTDVILANTIINFKNLNTKIVHILEYVVENM